MTDTPTQMLARLGRFFDQGAERLGVIGGSPRVLYAWEDAQRVLRAVRNDKGGRKPATTWNVGLPVVRAHMKAGASKIEALREAHAAIRLLPEKVADRKETFDLDQALHRWYNRAVAAEAKASSNPVR